MEVLWREYGIQCISQLLPLLLISLGHDGWVFECQGYFRFARLLKAEYTHSKVGIIPKRDDEWFQIKYTFSRILFPRFYHYTALNNYLETFPTSI